MSDQRSQVLYRRFFLLPKRHKRNRKLRDEIYSRSEEKLPNEEDLIELFAMERRPSDRESVVMEYLTSLDVDVFYCMVDRIEGRFEEEVLVEVKLEHVKDVYNRWKDRKFEKKELDFGGCEEYFQFHQDVPHVLNERSLSWRDR